MDNTTLVQTHIVFRHGEKLFDQESTYPTDPYRTTDNFFPYKRGELSLDGRKNAYKLGEDLYEIYKDFIGLQFYSNIVEATSSDLARTKLTLLCVLAALFPANEEFQLDKGLTWQPILYSTIKAEEDDMLLIVYKYPEILTMEFPNSDEESQRILDYINLHSGHKKGNGVYSVYRALQYQASKNLKLPEWTDKIWPEPIITLSIEWLANMWKTKLNTFVEKLISKIIADSKKVFNGSTFDVTKMYIYSGHDINIGALLMLILNPVDLNDVDYLSTFIFEVHQINNVFGMKFLYRSGIEGDFKYLQIPDYGTFVPLEEFEKFVNFRLSPRT